MLPVLTCGRTSGIFNWYKESPIEASDNSASGVKVWILTTMVGLLMAIVTFFAVRIIDTVDETEAAVHSMKEVQASQGEIIKGLQRDQDNANKEIERLRDQVDRLKDDNANLKAKAGIPLTLNNEPPSGGFFVSIERCHPAAFFVFMVRRRMAHDLSGGHLREVRPLCPLAP